MSKCLGLSDVIYEYVVHTRKKNTYVAVETNTHSRIRSVLFCAFVKFYIASDS